MLFGSDDSATFPCCAGVLCQVVIFCEQAAAVYISVQMRALHICTRYIQRRVWGQRVSNRCGLPLGDSASCIWQQAHCAWIWCVWSQVRGLCHYQFLQLLKLWGCCWYTHLCWPTTDCSTFWNPSLSLRALRQCNRHHGGGVFDWSFRHESGTSVCVYVYIYIYTHLHMCVCIHIYRHTYTHNSHTHTHTHTYA